MMPKRPLMMCSLLAGLVLTACTAESPESTPQEPSLATATMSTTKEVNDAQQKEKSSTPAAKEEKSTQPVPPNVLLDDEDPTSEAEAAPEPDTSCGSDDAQSAFAQGVSQVPLWGTIGWELFDSSGYDPCASLSWETLMIEGGTSSSPFHIMLFNHGEYLGTATAKPYGFAPTIERVSDSEIAVTYHWPREGEGNANRSGTTDAGFRSDEGQQKVIMSGDVPPTSVGS